ncbi:alpha/beta-Hydrolases superfamily protein [Rhynchospora pubera]|uniref:GPI inositol-deacylase n=1 Tax=Rhynchospora pubera TaxID=906938 RepID=A0AAV8EQE5_9POAL|nr:alpha/beta-Hydrolases superfamily protein [Rhynchospora pubera]
MYYPLVLPLALAMFSLLPAINSQRTSICFSLTSSSAPSTPRPAVILPGLGNNTGDYEGLVATLKEGYNVPCVVAQVSRFDWLRNATGLVDPNYWKGTLQPSPVLDWYLKRVEKAISDAKLLCTDENKGVSLIGHSAGGWLARVYMHKFGFSDISLLLTLGCPHLPPPKGVQGVIDQTRGLLDYVAVNCPPAVYTPELRYVCIAGRYILGALLTGGSNSPPDEHTSGDTNSDGDHSLPSEGNSKNVPTGPTFQARFVGQGYKQVCGKADVWGDGVVPEMAAHLEGALNISLEGVYHSPVGSDDHTRPWFGSPSVVDKWAHHLLN